MFYCNPCAEKHDWPISLMTSYGRCEICCNTASCNDVPSRLLPPVERKENE